MKFIPRSEDWIELIFQVVWWLIKLFVTAAIVWAILFFLLAITAGY